MAGDSYSTSRAIFLLLHILGASFQRERIDIVLWNGSIKMEIEGGEIFFSFLNVTI